ncbi:hypothetical protein E4N74_07410 [Treponema putidum]|uniref:Uncharacterized protein n=1 Tax=Treponema putidum TaxID=221027 RepID=A0AAE9MTB7_9SPIR|nr:hypothetical protein E4N75_07780 [Treponema putidum]UTY33849.1 hypothetical protein E4N74_07410 [Treponema putidum]
MYTEFKSNRKAVGDKNLNEDKTPEQIFIEQRTELFLKEVKKYPVKFRYGAKRFIPKFKYVKSNLHLT